MQNRNQEEDIRPGVEIEEEMMPEPTLRPSSGGKSSRFDIGGGLGKQILVSLVVVVFLVFMVLPFMGGGSFVTKKDFETNLANLTSSISQVTADVGGRQGEVNAAIQNIPTTVSNAVNQALGEQTNQISNLSNTLSTLSGDINTVKNNMATNSQEITRLRGTVEEYVSKIDDLNAEITDLEKRIDDLEGGVSSGTTTSKGGVKATVRTISNAMIASGNTTMSGAIRVELKNTTAVAVSDIVLEVSILTDIIQGYTGSSLTGGGTIWQGQGIPWNMMSFMNTQWGLNLAANETKVIYLTYTVTGTGFIPTYQIYGVPFQVNVSVI